VKVKVKTITLKKRGGGTRKQKVQVLASGKFKFIKNSARSTNRKVGNPHNRKRKNRRKNTMAKNRKRRSNNHITQTAFKFIRIGALVIPGVAEQARYTQYDSKLKAILRVYTGYEYDAANWNPEHLIKGYGPYIAVNVIHRLVGKLNGIISRL